MRARKSLALWIVLALLGASLVGGVSVVLADENDEDDSSGPGRRARDRDVDDEERRGPSPRPEFWPAERRPGFFVEHRDAFDGRFVDFRFDSGACKVTDYRVLGILFFDSVILPAPCELESHRGQGEGASIEIEADDKAEVKIHDTPNALIHFRARGNASIGFRIADNVTVNSTEHGLALVAGDLRARLFVDADDDDEGTGGLVWDAGARTATTSGRAEGNFLAHPAQGLGKREAQIGEAIHRGRVGAQVDVLVENGVVKHEVLAFDDVVIRVSRQDDSKFRFLIDANVTQGRVIVLNFAAGAFREGDVGLRFFELDADGVPTEVEIRPADSLEDVLLIEPGEGPEFRIVRDGDVKRVLLAVPHFSAKLVEIQGLDAVVVPTVVFGVVAGVAFVALASAGMLMGRRRA